MFPVSIKNEDFLAIVRDPSTQELAGEIRKEVSSCNHRNLGIVEGICVH